MASPSDSPAPQVSAIPGVPDETFEALMFDWDGTAVPDRSADAAPVRLRIESLCSTGVHVFVVSGTHVENIDGQLQVRPRGPGRLYLCCNRGSEVFEVGSAGPRLVFRRTASAEEDAALGRAAARTVELLRARGLAVVVDAPRLNRRKIDLIPEPAWSDPKKADIALLLEAVQARLTEAGIANLSEVVALARDAARWSGLADPRITSDVKHVEIGLTDKSESARWTATWLSERGITGSLVLIAGDEFGPVGGIAGSDSFMVVEELARSPAVSVGVEPDGVPQGVVHVGAGPARFLELLDVQHARRAAHRVPQIDPDPAWIVPLPGEPAKEGVAESLGTLANGFTGTRGSREEDGPGALPMLLVSGVFTGDDHLGHGPIWTDLDIPGDGARPEVKRVVDLHTGVLARMGNGATGMRSLRFVSAVRPHAMALRAEATPSLMEPGAPVRPPPKAEGFEHQRRGDADLAKTGPIGGEIGVAARGRARTAAGLRVVERLAVVVTAPSVGSIFDSAGRRLAEMNRLGFDALLAEHRQAWAHRWADAEVVIDGDPEAELAARFAVFHLLGAAADVGESGVGARGLSGDTYGGHVFWDADVFVLPVLAAIRPPAAPSILEYRIRRLPAARAAATSLGRRGARFPWESARDGSDVTPRRVTGPDGEIVAITTSAREEHIVADVAWAATHFAAWTGEADFIRGAGRDLVVETARYWASRIRVDADGKGHLDGVMGPDEYHQVVDDDAYTNVMARWNLRQGARLLGLSGDTEEAHAWRALAEELVDGWRADRGLYEQFAGYFELEPLVVSQFATPPVAIDTLLGPERVARSQLIKQTDVLMLHHMVPGEVVPGSLAPCLDFYEPRTAHGSSLSPAVSASLLARAKRPDEALDFFRLAARMDLDDVTGSTAGGLHLATMGGLWQALAFGFLGLRAESGALAIDPCLPSSWSGLGLRFRLGGNPVGVRAEHGRVIISCQSPLVVRLAGQAPARCGPPGLTLLTGGRSQRETHGHGHPKSSRT